MSAKVTGWIWDADLSRDEKFILLAYADMADHEGDSIMPSNRLVAWMTGYAVSSIKRIKTKLLRDGYLIDTGEIDPRYQTPIYRIDKDSLPKRELRTTKDSRQGRPEGQKTRPKINPAQNKPGLFSELNLAHSCELESNNMNPKHINSKELTDKPLQALPPGEYDQLCEVLKGNLDGLYSFLREKTGGQFYTEEQLLTILELEPIIREGMQHERRTTTRDIIKAQIEFQSFPLGYRAFAKAGKLKGFGQESRRFNSFKAVQDIGDAVGEDNEKAKLLFDIQVHAVEQHFWARQHYTNALEWLEYGELPTQTYLSNHKRHLASKENGKQNGRSKNGFALPKDFDDEKAKAYDDLASEITF